MGTFSYLIGIGTPDGSRYEEIQALVDTGSSYTVVPTSLLSRLGVSRAEKRPFRLADDRIVEKDIGYTQVRIDARSVVTIVVFGDERPEPLLGAYALEGLGLAVDPLGKRLIPVPGLLM